jgi:hypothetical protein
MQRASSSPQLYASWQAWLRHKHYSRLCQMKRRVRRKSQRLPPTLRGNESPPRQMKVVGILQQPPLVHHAYSRQDEKRALETFAFSKVTRCESPCVISVRLARATRHPFILDKRHRRRSSAVFLTRTVDIYGVLRERLVEWRLRTRVRSTVTVVRSVSDRPLPGRPLEAKHPNSSPQLFSAQKQTLAQSPTSGVGTLIAATRTEPDQCPVRSPDRLPAQPEETP